MRWRVNYILIAAIILGCCSSDQGSEAPESGETPVTPETEHAHTNRLAKESSPYLLQHAHNPVDWYPWGEEAFEKARKEDKPVFLSIGYSTCHWCHVMERESFENEETAALLNEHFVAIKVDREERPDVDNVYMAAVQALSGHGGWPLSVFLTPEGKPFWGGTYFPPEDRFGRPGFKSVLVQIAGAWREKREEVLEGAERLTQFVADLNVTVKGAALDEKTLANGVDEFASRFDSRRGGFESAPKFPRTHSLSFLLRQHARTGDAQVLAMVEKTLAEMARGGIYDHVGGGFHRYSTDPLWLVPHFEKMLYDQALVARASLEAYQVTGKPVYADLARDVFRYVLRDMTDEKGGFYSAEDADSEGVEGKFYVWTRDEILEVLGEADGELFAKVYDVKADGNFREEASGEETGTNILHLERPLEETAGELGTDAAGLAKRLAPMREKLFAVRERRIHPLKDDKILTDWNGLMIGTLAYAGRTLDEPRYTEAARKAADFLLTTMVSDGRLLHRYRGGQASILAFLDDHAFLTLGLLDLYEATFEERWLAEAKRLAGETIRLFWDESAGGFLFSGKDGE
ncbi:MAG: thioredoxin domain-containing protein, partial [Planctomycetota bacterium]